MPSERVLAAELLVAELSAELSGHAHTAAASTSKHVAMPR